MSDTSEKTVTLTRREAVLVCKAVTQSAYSGGSARGSVALQRRLRDHFALTHDEIDPDSFYGLRELVTHDVFVWLRDTLVTLGRELFERAWAQGWAKPKRDRSLSDVAPGAVFDLREQHDPRSLALTTVDRARVCLAPFAPHMGEGMVALLAENVPWIFNQAADVARHRNVNRADVDPVLREHVEQHLRRFVVWRPEDAAAAYDDR